MTQVDDITILSKCIDHLLYLCFDQKLRQQAVRSKLPCSVICPPDRYRALRAERVQSIPKADAPDLLISWRENQQPYQIR